MEWYIWVTKLHVVNTTPRVAVGLLLIIVSPQHRTRVLNVNSIITWNHKQANTYSMYKTLVRIVTLGSQNVFGWLSPTTGSVVTETPAESATFLSHFQMSRQTWEEIFQVSCLIVFLKIYPLENVRSRRVSKHEHKILNVERKWTEDKEFMTAATTPKRYGEESKRSWEKKG